MNDSKWLNYLERFIGPISDRAIPCLPYLDWLSDKKEILDVGCGTGRLFNHLIEIGKRARGITLNKKEIKGLKNSSDLYLGDVHKLPFRDALFDAVIAWDVIEHTVAPFIALSEIYRVLRPKGKFLCYIPGEDWIDCDYHCIVLNAKQFKHLSKLVGFSSVEEEHDETRSATGGGTIYKVIK